MEPSGLIFAALDCDADAVEAWNRWYDLEHTPPNVLLDGVMLSRRYVAPPDLHAARVAAPDSPFAGGRATFLGRVPPAIQALMLAGAVVVFGLHVAGLVRMLRVAPRVAGLVTGLVLHVLQTVLPETSLLLDVTNGLQTSAEKGGSNKLQYTRRVPEELENLRVGAKP